MAKPSNTPEPLDACVSMVVANHPPEEHALGWLRYEVLRTMNPRQFGELHQRNLLGERFDDLVTQAFLEMIARKQPTRSE